MDMTWVTGRIAVGGGIWNEENMAAVAQAGISHVIDMQIEFDDTPLGHPFGVEVRGIRLTMIFYPSLPRCFSGAWSLRLKHWISRGRSCISIARRSAPGAHDDAGFVVRTGVEAE